MLFITPLSFFPLLLVAFILVAYRMQYQALVFVIGLIFAYEPWQIVMLGAWLVVSIIIGQFRWGSE
jgi:hypothetical protein